MKNWVTVMVMVVLGGTGCGESSPAEKCEDLVSLVCDRAVECIAGAAGMHSDCVHGVQQEISCSATKSVGPRYDDCMDLLDEQSCGTLFSSDLASGERTLQLPAACVGVIMTQSVRGEPTPVLRTPVRPANPLGGLIVQVRAELTGLTGPTGLE